MVDLHRRHPQPLVRASPTLPSNSTPFVTKPDTSPPNPAPYPSLEEFDPSYKNFNPDQKLALITSIRAGILASKAREENPERTEVVLQALAEDEKRGKESDNLLYKMFRSIAWGPTILMNALLALFFS